MEKQSFRDYCRNLWKVQGSREVFFLSVAYGLCVGVLYAVETLLETLLPSESFVQRSYLGVVMLFACMYGAVVGGWLVDYSQEHKIVTIGLTSATTFLIGVIAVLSCDEASNLMYVLLYILFALVGTFLGAIVTAGFEWGSKLVSNGVVGFNQRAVSESTIAGVLNVWAQLMGVLVICGLEYSLEFLSTFTAWILLVGIMGFSTSFFFHIKDGKHQRLVTRVEITYNGDMDLVCQA
eukprot:CAMPEP_0185791024 /NCGR_PEP_ID=MMETSP1174-20130828/158131_1 /TAXON_ID=35687 /ORGANISM="Dictyocha speculum, Strain CCMP1381" /LENGTH=235 /DNA_ID=CAMNT_0028485901 /DNA_START=1490 /DNA_END=2197 /DNA_ORIENTATION=-